MRTAAGWHWAHPSPRSADLGDNETRRQTMLIHLFNGLVYGALLIVMCSGLALIYGLRRVVNFAHGSLYMLGAYLGYTIASYSNFWIALVAAPAIMLLLGAALDRFG